MTSGAHRQGAESHGAHRHGMGKQSTDRHDMDKRDTDRHGTGIIGTDRYGTVTNGAAARVAALDRIPLFDPFDADEKALLANALREQSAAMGETLVGGDNQGECFYIVKAGQVRKIGISPDGAETNLGLLGSGEAFGEQALLDTPPDASVGQIHVRAATDAYVLALEKQAFRRIVASHPALEQVLREYLASDIMRSFLKQHTVLTHVDHSAIRSLLGCMTLREYPPAAPLVREGDAGDTFYILKSGVAAVEREGRVVNRLYPGDFFGELALLTGQPRKATVRAEVPVTAYQLAKADFDRLIVAYPVLLDAIRRISDYYTTEAMPQAPGSTGKHAGEQMELAGEQAAKQPSKQHSKQPSEQHGKQAAGHVAQQMGLSATVGQPGEQPGEQPATATQPADSPTALSTASPTAPFTASPAAPSTASPAVSPAAPTRWRFWRRASYPALLQQNDMDCGPTCLTMIARYYGLRASINRMRERCNVGTEGTSLRMLAETAEALGFAAKAYKATGTMLQALQAPVILHWDGNHYVVAYRGRSGRVLIADPALGYADWRPLAEVEQHWSGYMLALTLTPQLVPLDEKERLWSRYGAFFKPYRKLLLGSLGLAVAVELGLLVFPVLTQQLFDRVLLGSGLPLLELIFLALVVFVCALAAGTAVREWLVNKLGYRIDEAMLGAFYTRLLQLPFPYFARRTSGDVITRVYEHEKIRRLLTDHGLNLVLDGLSLLVYGGIMFYYHAGLALLTLSVLPLYAVLYGLLLPRMRRNRRQLMIAEGEAQTQVVEAVGAMGTIKAAAAEGRFVQSLHEKLRKQLAISYAGGKLETISTAGSLWIRALCQVALLYAGVQLVLAEQLTLGEFVAFTVMFGGFLFALENISRLFGETAEGRIAMERLNDVYEATVEHPDPAALRWLPRLRGHIRLDKVSFAYSKSAAPVLRQISLELKPGQTVALVGRSGSGKSTFANLLLKLFEPTEGTITIDGYPLRQAHAESMRRQVGYVQQEVTIFRGTIAENIALRGGGEATPEEIVRVSRLAGAHAFIEQLPLGYDTQIGEGGMRLSGGQKQRLAIARALLGDPRILVFDEATSALDTESERIIQENMGAIVRDRTTLIIAHRLSTIRSADVILVLDGGRIAEHGTHDELLRKKGLYHYLIHQQAGPA